MEQKAAAYSLTESIFVHSKIQITYISHYLEFLICYRKRKCSSSELCDSMAGCSESIEASNDVPVHDSDSNAEAACTQSTESSTSSGVEALDSGSEEESDEEIESDDMNNVEQYYGPPLYVIPPSDDVYSSNITVEQHMLAACAFATKHNISTEMFQDLMTLLNLHLPVNNLCELDVSKIKQQCGFDPDMKNVHEFCSKCGAIKQDENAVLCHTPGCGNKYDDINGQYFVSINVGPQIKSILERDENWAKVQNCHNLTRSGAITDITDGLEYLKLRQSGGFLAPPSNNVTFTFFTDGIPLFKSSKVSLWPVYLVLNELPPNERYLKKNMILWGLWQGVSKPKMNTFFMKLVSDLTDLYTKGVELNIHDNSVTCKAMLIVLTMDLQARAYVLNMTQHNGEYGCIFCEHPGEMVKKGKGQVRCYPYKDVPSVKRTDESLRIAASQAAETQSKVKGMQGRSVFMCLSYLSLVSSIVIDYMHGTLLGVTKKLLSLWFDTVNQDKHFYIGRKVKAIDLCIKSIKPPYLIHRLPRKIENTFNHWKASELRSWLLFYSLPCLKGHLPENFLIHYSCLVEAVFLLLGDCISEEQIKRAEQLIKVFVKHYETIYGKENMGLNVHNLIHMVDGVRNWGPLWAYSCFGFESFNGEILKTVHGTGNVCNQIFWSLQAQKYLEKQVVKMPAGSIKIFFNRMLRGQSHKLPVCVEAYQCSVAKPLTTIKLNDLAVGVKEQLINFGTCENSNLQKSKKILRYGFIFYSNEKSRVKKRNSFTVRLEQRLETGEDVVQVKYYILNDKKRVFGVCDTFRTFQSYIDNRMNQLQKVREVSHNKVVPCTLFLETVIFIHGTEGPCIIKMPNKVERD